MNASSLGKQEKCFGIKGLKHGTESETASRSLLIDLHLLGKVESLTIFSVLSLQQIT